MKKKELSIPEAFPITDDEYNLLEDKFGKLTKKAAWELLRKNTKNNHTDEFEDINQELSISMMRATSYYKRQCYIEKCFEVVKKYTKDKFALSILRELEDLWDNKTKHGAGRQKFGPFQEKILAKIVNKVVPVEERPKRNAPLRFDNAFEGYCKSIMWNEQRNMGRKITKEKTIRTGLVSLSEFSHYS